MSSTRQNNNNNGAEMRKHEHQLLLRFSDTEKNKIIADCESLGYSNRTQYMRDLIRGSYPYIHLYREVVNELRKQGVNLNQAARYCNEERQVDEEVLRVLNTIAKANTEILRTIREAR